MSARDDLARAIFLDAMGAQHAAAWDTPAGGGKEGWLRRADAVIAAGWRPPARVFTTVEEIEALPVGTVLLDALQWPWRMRRDGWLRADGDEEWPEDFDSDRLPLTVIFEPSAEVPA